MLLPEPVGPVTKIRPLFLFVNSFTISGNFNSFKLGIFKLTTLKEIAILPLCLNTLTLNLPKPDIE